MTLYLFLVTWRKYWITLPTITKVAIATDIGIKNLCYCELSSDKKISSILFVGAIDPWGFEGGGADIIKVYDGSRDSSGMLDKGTMDNEKIND